MDDYPVITRNRTPWPIRGMIIGWLAFLALVTWQVNVQSPPPPSPLWPYALAVFWIAGLLFLLVALRLEDAVLTIERPAQAILQRGSFWRPSIASLDRVELSIAKENDGDGGDYFKLILAAPHSPLAIAESGRRDKVEEVRQRIETAYAGKVVGELGSLA